MQSQQETNTEETSKSSKPVRTAYRKDFTPPLSNLPPIVQLVADEANIAFEKFTIDYNNLFKQTEGLQKLETYKENKRCPKSLKVTTTLNIPNPDSVKNLLTQWEELKKEFEQNTVELLYSMRQQALTMLQEKIKQPIKNYLIVHLNSIMVSKNLFPNTEDKEKEKENSQNSNTQQPLMNCINSNDLRRIKENFKERIQAYQYSVQISRQKILSLKKQKQEQKEKLALEAEATPTKEVLKQLVHHEVQKQTNNKKWCPFHKNATHNKSECYKLKAQSPKNQQNKCTLHNTFSHTNANCKAQQKPQHQQQRHQSQEKCTLHNSFTHTNANCKVQQKQTHSIKPHTSPISPKRMQCTIHGICAHNDSMCFQQQRNQQGQQTALPGQQTAPSQLQHCSIHGNGNHNNNTCRQQQRTTTLQYCFIHGHCNHNNNTCKKQIHSIPTPPHFQQTLHPQQQPFQHTFQPPPQQFHPIIPSQFQQYPTQIPPPQQPFTYKTALLNNSPAMSSSYPKDIGRQQQFPHRTTPPFNRPQAGNYTLRQQ